MRPAKRKRRKRASANAAGSAPVGAEKRAAPRIPILAQVEAQGERQTVLGRAANISVGSLLVETPETLSEGTTVIVRFFVPRQRRPIEAAGRVVRVEPGQSMAISFLGLLESHRQKITDYIAITGEFPVIELGELPERVLGKRRSGRLRRRLPVIVTWQDEEGYQKQQGGETLLLSKYGALLLLYTPLPPGQLVRLMLPDTNREASARIVFAATSPVPGRVQVGLELMGVENFWGIEFPPPEPASKLTRRRGGRVEQEIAVSLNWVDEWSRLREETAATRVLSQHGALLSLPVEMDVGQHLRLRVMETGREVEAKVVWTQPAEAPGQSNVGIEFIGTGEFWNLPFPPDPGASRS